ncbi:MAG: SAM-dependent methyltransferase [Lachnospiraceae bacterium]|nr:SAM-dependent methyltransferase [Lachnospiraceae bacterium]
MNLSKRLMTAVNMVTEGFAVLDVGCDHAYTSIELVRRKSPCAVASDVRPGPLKAAREHIAEAGLEDKVTTVLADGVPRNIIGLLPENIHASLVITGMGGMLIIKILSEAAELLERFDELILSPQSDIYAVRKYLAERSYVFIDEAEILEDGKFYTLMKVHLRKDDERDKSTKPDSQRESLAVQLSDAELTYGPCLLRKKDETLKAYLIKRRNVLTDIKEKLIESGRGADDTRIREIDEEVRLIDEAERYY